ncbi:hypothetical protein RIF29_21244 [Crotalaria pallida]|uniref:Uncharacterized protein n=1 Tax=Crotalaria pallida TaxID=3830 RepID=A0AAN9F701_CROPI
MDKAPLDQISSADGADQSVAVGADGADQMARSASPGVVHKSGTVVGASSNGAVKAGAVTADAAKSGAARVGISDAGLDSGLGVQPVESTNANPFLLRNSNALEAVQNIKQFEKDTGDATGSASLVQTGATSGANTGAETPGKGTDVNVIDLAVESDKNEGKWTTGRTRSSAQIRYEQLKGDSKVE